MVETETETLDYSCDLFQHQKTQIIQLKDLDHDSITVDTIVLLWRLWDSGEPAGLPNSSSFIFAL